MSETTDKSGYDKLSPQRKKIADMLLANLESGAGVWKQGWRSGGAPENAITGKQYRGVNNLFLLLVSMERGYKDNRWLTFNQMKAREWSFKTDEAGRSLGKNAGVPVEFFDLWDRETHNKFDRTVLDGLSADERQTYMDENVYPIRRYYTVFNADLIDGIPAKEERVLDESAKTERAERMISNWSENESKIVYGGSQAYYSKASDEIHLPIRGDFYDLQEFYATALHEIGHSTGHAKRLSRDLSGKFGSPEYAMEELRAEIASVFLEQDFGVEVDESAVRNNSAYIQHWKTVIQKDPNALFTAIADADKISKYILQKEKELSREVEPYAVSEEEDENGDLKYRVYMASGYGQIRTVPLSGDAIERQISEYRKQIEDNVKLMNGTQGDKNRYVENVRVLNDKIVALRKQLEIVRIKIAENSRVDENIEELKKILSDEDMRFTEFDDVIVRRVVEMIRVGEGGKITIFLKAAYL